jgi:hypothetical protein
MPSVVHPWASDILMAASFMCMQIVGEGGFGSFDLTQLTREWDNQRMVGRRQSVTAERTTKTILTSSDRLAAPILAIRLARCTSTVRALMFKS